MRRWRIVIGSGLLLATCGILTGAHAKEEVVKTEAGGELYVVATAHLDTQWRWTVRQTIEEYLPSTLASNFAFFAKYPDYVFSFEGAFRYMLMKEYYPEEYEKLKAAIAAGRWRVAGSWVDAVDTNIPSPESLIRHVLYGNGYFRREFGKTSKDVFLPDCFGFGYALPSIAAHCGLTGFSTQKLEWGSAYGIPFDVGLWEGVDGSRLVAALNPGSYVSEIGVDLSADSAVVATIAKQKERSGHPVALRYFGTGDIGGGPTEESVAWLEKSIHGAGPVRVRSVSSDQLARDIAGRPAELEGLPVYKGELVMTDHGTGCYTSQAAMKRWNRKNELLADAAERASVAAHWLGGAVYPREAFREGWVRFLWHQFHDDLTGTSIPQAYVYSWNDEAICENRFAALLTDAVGTVSRALDTRTEGIPLVVYNPLSFEREDAVEAWVEFEEDAPEEVCVVDPDGREVLSQILKRDGRALEIVFLAKIPSVGFAVYDVRPAEKPCASKGGGSVGKEGIENDTYRVRIDAAGNIASIFDKLIGKELLAGPIQLQLIADQPHDWPAWEVDYDDLMAPPRSVVGGPAQIRVIEQGPARMAIEVVRGAEGSTVRQVIRLAGGHAGTRVDVETDLDWRTKGTLLKAAFPLAARDSNATYDLGLGAIERGVNKKELYEMPGQKWADVSDRDGSFGVAILNDCKYGWDRPDAGTLRLSLVHTPEVNERWSGYADQQSMDLGQHRFAYAVVGHAGSWRAGRVVDEAARLNQPLRAFQVAREREAQAASAQGSLGRRFSLVTVSDPTVRVSALKMAEEGSEIVVRLQETVGWPVDPIVTFLAPVVGAHELNGAEEGVGWNGEVTSHTGGASGRQGGGGVFIFQPEGTLGVHLGAYQPRAYAVKLAPPRVPLEPPRSVPFELPYDRVGLTACRTPNAADLDGSGHSYPGELLPETFDGDGIEFRTGPRDGRPNVLTCRAQTIPLPAAPAGSNGQLYLLAAAFGGDREGIFLVDDHPTRLWVQDGFERIASWNNRLQGGRLHEEPDQILPGYVKTDRIAWTGTHLHRTDGGREAYDFAQIYRYRIDLPPGARRLVLPDDERIVLFAASVARDPNVGASPAGAMIETLHSTLVHLEAADREFLDPMVVRLDTPIRGATIRYTLDRTEPTAQSAVYTGPIRLSASTTVKARAFHPDMDDRYVATEEFVRLTLRPAVKVRGTKPGLVSRYFEDVRWRKLPDFAALTPVRTDVLERVQIPAYARAEDYGLALRGYLKVPRDGLYKLHLWSDDGSVLTLGGEKWIDNDGLHGRDEVARNVALKEGLHPFTIEYFQAPGDAALELWIEGPELALQPVPPEMFVHD